MPTPETLARMKAVVGPKVAKFEKVFHDKLKEKP